MTVTGERPSAGLRIVVERPVAPAHAPFAYAGAAHAPDQSFPIRAQVEADGAVTVTCDPSSDGGAPPRDLADKVRLLLRTALRQANADGQPPPRRIVRWRGEK